MGMLLAQSKPIFKEKPGNPVIRWRRKADPTYVWFYPVHHIVTCPLASPGLQQLGRGVMSVQDPALSWLPCCLLFQLP